MIVATSASDGTAEEVRWRRVIRTVLKMRRTMNQRLVLVNTKSRQKVPVA